MVRKAKDHYRLAWRALLMAGAVCGTSAAANDQRSPAISEPASPLPSSPLPSSPPPSSPPPSSPPPSSYADVAVHAADAAAIIDARIRRAVAIDPARARGVAAGMMRLYVEADVNGVIYGRNPVAGRVSYLVDVTPGADGKPPRLRRQRVLLFTRPVVIANQLQLADSSAQILWDAGREATARAIAAELAQGPPPPAITGVSQAFHVRGTVPGEGETQIFLRTATAQPVSLTILRRPGESRRWAAAFGEIVDEAARPPRQRTLGWYRLACGLAPALPAAALVDATPDDAAIIADDYALVRRAVGPCDRTSPLPTDPRAR